jgi:hypothetical protein
MNGKTVPEGGNLIGAQSARHCRKVFVESPKPFESELRGIKQNLARNCPHRIPQMENVFSELLDP